MSESSFLDVASRDKAKDLFL